MSFDLTKFGGRPILPHGITALADVPADQHAFNFGVKEDAAASVRFRDTPSLMQVAPKIGGSWDGKSTVNHVDAILKNFSGDWTKVEELIQYQPRGTCGGRAGSAAGDIIQHVLVALGKRAKVHRVSHAAVYYAARKLYNDIGGSWTNDNNDGVASGSVPEALSKVAGYVQREEDGDTNYYGQGSDDLACQLAAGLHPEVAKKIIDLGADNFITWAPVKNAQELADGIAAGGVGVGSDSQGFTMTRDKYGRCQPTGTWAHYQVRVSIGVYDCGPMFGYWQSWGKGTPAGPPLPGHPSNCFGVDFSVQDRIIKSGEWAVVFGFPLWDLDVAPVVPWVF